MRAVMTVIVRPCREVKAHKNWVPTAIKKSKQTEYMMRAEDSDYEEIKLIPHIDVLVHYCGYRFRSHIPNFNSIEQICEHIIQLLRIPQEYCPPEIKVLNTSKYKWNQGVWEFSVKSKDPLPLQWIFAQTINIKTEAVAIGAGLYKENSTVTAAGTHLDKRSDSSGVQSEQEKLPSYPEPQFQIPDEVIELNHISLSDYKKPGKRSIKIILQMQDKKRTFIVCRSESVQPQSFIDQFCKYHKLNKKDLNIFSKEGIVHIEMKNN